MPAKTVFSGSVQFVQVLDKDGKADKKLLPLLSDEQLKQLYYWMLYSRQADEKLLRLQRSGKMGTFAQVKGQEAQVGVALALKKEDWLIPSFRENALLWALGVKFEEIAAIFGGEETGHQFSGLNILPLSIPVGTQPLHGCGIAWAFKLKKEKKVAVTFFGDGATSEGDFHEALNFAAVFQLPCVFICQNNQYAISVPRKQQTRSESLAQKAMAYGMEGIQVDGNDVLAVYRIAKYAIEKARLSGGPTLIEMVTYRLADHTTADDATKYRTQEEVAYWLQRDPIERMKLFLKSKKVWSEKTEEKIGLDIQAKIEQSVRNYDALPATPLTNMFDFLFHASSVELQKQRNQALEWKKRREGSV